MTPLPLSGRTDMLKVTTASGAVYLINGNKAMREGPYSPNINYLTVPDNQWTLYREIRYVPGGSLVMYSRDGYSDRVTTKVVNIEEVE